MGPVNFHGVVFEHTEPFRRFQCIVMDPTGPTFTPAPRFKFRKFEILVFHPVTAFRVFLLVSIANNKRLPTDLDAPGCPWVATDIGPAGLWACQGI